MYDGYKWWFNLDLAFKFFIFHAKKPPKHSSSLQIRKYPIQACCARVAGDATHNIAHHHLLYYCTLQLLFEAPGSFLKGKPFL
jgi:hypothetical protein